MIITLSILLVALLAYLIYIPTKLYRSMEDFTESIVNKDFSREYSEKGKNKKLYKQFNAITNSFRNLSIEKEAQQDYLVQMLKLVDTGILAYDQETNEILWMNDSFTTMLHIPYIKSINWLKKHNEMIFHELLNIPLHENKLITFHLQIRTIKIMSKASLFKTGGKTYKLIAFHNVSATMEEVESGAWKGLLNVMTHEIMNSIVPISSLSDILIRKLQASKNFSYEIFQQDMEPALETIHRRSEGLLRFAETYRSLSQKIVPNVNPHNLYELINSVYFLMSPSIQQKNISFDIKTNDPVVTVSLDRDLIEQVVINFITNAISAINGKVDPQIRLFSGIDKAGRPFITVADNGEGISPDIRDKIFIPFFSTKKNGNGIGLSISREIVKLHNGEIYIQSQEKCGSAFSILFSS